MKEVKTWTDIKRDKKKEKKNMADQDGVAWGQRGRESEMKGERGRYIYIM